MSDASALTVAPVGVDVEQLMDAAERVTVKDYVEQVSPPDELAPLRDVMPRIYEIPADRFVFELPTGMQVFEMGSLLITSIVAEPSGVVLTVSHRQRWPTWEEVAHARYTLVPDHIIMAMPLPSRIDFIHDAVGGAVKRTITLWQIRNTARA